mgnify:FL=1
MEAWVLHHIGDCRHENVAEPVPAAGEVLVEVRAAGICGSDIPRIYRTGAHVHPLIPGHEFSGVVVKAEGTQRKWLHRDVGVFPLIPCHDCGPCRNRQYEMCRHYDYLGSRRDGGFAQYAAVPADNLIALPDTVSFAEGAMLEPMAVAVHAMRRIAMEKRDRIVVCGLGTIGLLLVMFLKEAGMEHIFAVGNKAFQRQAAAGLGVPEDCYCDAGGDVRGWIAERTGGAGADVFFECVGKQDTVSLGVESAAPGGRVVLVGNPASDMTLAKNCYWKILRSQLTMTGTWNTTFTHEPDDDWHYVCNRLQERRIDPAALITHRFPLEEAGNGFALMRDKTEEYGKVMIILS